MYILIVLTYLSGFLTAISVLLLVASFTRGDYHKYPGLARIQGMKLRLIVLTCILLIISYVSYVTKTSKDQIQEGNVEVKESSKPNNTSDLIRQHSDLHQEDNRKIEPIDVDLEDPTTKTVHFTPASQRHLCPTHIGGDRDFRGNGPVVTVSARLRQLTNTRIEVNIRLHAIETRPDWTEAEGSWRFPVYTAPSGWVIDDILTDKYSESKYTDTGSSPYRPRVVGNLVNSFIIVGDTQGNDIGNCTSNDMYVTVQFNQVTVRLKEKKNTCTSEQINTMVKMGWTPDQIKLFCSNYRDTESPRTKLDHFTPASQRRLCPTDIGGFKDHGIIAHALDVKASARLIQIDDSRIDVRIHLHVKETRPDWTEAEGLWEFKGYAAPPGWCIDGIETDLYSESNYTDADLQPDRPSVVGNLVNYFIINGNTGGYDTDYCTSDDMYVTVQFNQVTVRLREK